MAFEYIKRRYNVPAELGREVVMDGRKGVITEDCGHYLGVIFYDDPNKFLAYCHPTWAMEYLDTFNPQKNKEKMSKKQKVTESDEPLCEPLWPIGAETFTRKEVIALIETQQSIIFNDVMRDFFCADFSEEMVEMLSNPRAPKF